MSPSVVGQMRSWPARRWIAAAAVALVTAAVIAVPTGLIGTPFYSRMTPVTWWSWPIWVTTAILAGVLAATYVRTPAPMGGGGGAGTGGGLLSALAVGCPVCNKIVVLAVGVSGALQWWAPLQPLLGLAGLALLGYELWKRLLTEAACPLAPRKATTAEAQP